LSAIKTADELDKPLRLNFAIDTSLRLKETQGYKNMI